MRGRSRGKGRRTATRRDDGRFRALVEAAPYGMHFYRLERGDRLVFTGANPAADRILRVENAAFVGKTIEEAFPPLALTEVPDRYRAAARDGIPWHTQQISYQDGRITGAYEVDAFQTAPGEMAAVFQDVIGRRLATDELERERQRLAVTLSSIGDAVIATDGGGRVTLMNPVAEALTGWSAAAATGRMLGEVFRVESAESGGPAGDPVARVLLHGAPVALSNHLLLVARDGTRRPIADSGAPIREPGGEVIGVVLVFRDRSAEREAERRLVEGEARYRAVVRSLPLVQWTTDRDGLFTLSEGLGLAMLGLKPGEMVGRTVAEVYRENPGVLGDFQRALAGESFQSENRLGPFTFESRWGPIRDEGGTITGVAGVAVDVTARRGLQDQVQRAQKLESVGRLAGGIAHDFNNLLTVVLSCAEVLREDAAAGRAAGAEDVEQIREAGQRAQELVRQLLAFGRKQVTAPEPTDLSEVVGGNEQMLRRLLGEDVELLVEREPGLWPVLCDRGHIEQVLLNLAVNARDAMPRGGRFTISTRNVPGGEAGDRGSDTVQLEVRDTGSGMSQDVKSHLFEPFFTTKPPGKGTGLGLATVYGLVTQNGGRIQVESEPGSGTAFEIAFPRCSRPSSASREPPATGRFVGSETVLVVEDDPLVRGITSRALRGAGYRVLEAGDGREAIEVVGEASGPVDLVVTDVVMPGMSGPTLAEELAARVPRLRVLFVSGYSREAMAERGVPEAGPGFLAKPFTASALLERVRLLLDGGR